MGLTADTRARIVVLGSLYFSQGLPRGLVTVVLIAYLAERGVADSESARLVGLFVLPWSLKVFWGPVIDTWAWPRFGRRRPWVVASQFCMAVSLVALLGVGDPTTHLQQLGWLLFVHNCFASLQDVSTDALAIEVIPPAHLASTNGVMWAAKLGGRSIGAIGSAYLVDRFSLAMAVTANALLLSILLIPVVLLAEPRLRAATSIGTAVPVTRRRRPSEVARDVQVALAARPTLAFAVLGFSVSMSEALMDVVAKPAYTIALGWTFVEFSIVTGVALLPQIVGAGLGAWAGTRLGLRVSMAIGFGLYGLMDIAMGTSQALWTSPWFPVAYLLLTAAADAFGAVPFLAMAMSVSRTTSSATIFSLLMAVCATGASIGSWLLGPLRDTLGFEHQTVFIVGGALIILPLALLIEVRPQTLEAHPAPVQAECLPKR